MEAVNALLMVLVVVVALGAVGLLALYWGFDSRLTNDHNR
jgi:cbb3-type cytochrome oxidase maturation protein